MRFDLDHDWQGNISTPRARVGERAKTRLLIILCAIWLLMGLIGHQPWKPYESEAISTIKTLLDNSNFIAPVPASGNHLVNPPLYYLSAALTAEIFDDYLPFHDGARIATGLWMLITLLMIGMTGRELWGKGFGRQTTFIFISTLGLIFSAHTMAPEISALTGIATSFYALSLVKRRPYRASALLGAGIVISFLSTGLLPIIIILLTLVALPSFFSHWRTLSFAKSVSLSILIATPLILVWCLLCYHFDALLFDAWWLQSVNQFGQFTHSYFTNLLLWYAWPSLPLAGWALWRYRTELLTQPKFQLCITFFIVAFGLIGTGGDQNQILALPLLIPLTAIASGSIETLKRGAASALNWFGLILFGFIGLLIWLGWNAMMSGQPEKLKERLIFLSGLPQLNFSILAFTAASAITLIWLFAVFRSHSNRAVATNWAIGMTFVWTLLMTLWLPMIDSARSYATVFISLKNALPAEYTCISSEDLGSAQRDFLHYYANVKTHSKLTLASANCDLFLIQDERNPKKVTLGSDWKQIWSGQRLSDRKESFRLFQQSN